MDVAHLMAAAVLFDIDGVLVLSWRAIPGAAETVRQLTHRGIACAYHRWEISPNSRSIGPR